MTIKQQGGIFGRNPTFNDVTVDGTLTSNSISLTSLDNVPIGSSTPSTGAFTTLDANSGTFGQQSTGSGLLSGVSDEFSVGLNQDNGNTSNTQIWNAFTNGASSATYQVRYRSANDTGTAAVRFQVNGATGDATINNGNLIIGTSGKGIDFSATSGTGTSELFDDYEEGTWTPTLAFGGGSVGITYAVQEGAYTKIGRQVTLTGRLLFTNIGSSTGAVTVTGLPFNAGTNYPASLIDANTGFTGLTAPTFFVLSGGTLYMSTQGATDRQNVTNASFTNGADMRFLVTYFV